MTTSKHISGAHALALSACVGAFTLLSATCLATPALAAGGLEMSTDYTGITAKPAMRAKSRSKKVVPKPETRMFSFLSI